MMLPHSMDERAAASAVANMQQQVPAPIININNKRSRVDSVDSSNTDDSNGDNVNKVARTTVTHQRQSSNTSQAMVAVAAPSQTTAMVGPNVAPPQPQQIVYVAASTAAKQVLRPYPYFYYRDFSMQSDPDPLTPVTAPGRVPNFPAKMHSILSRSDLSDIVAWMPHGRAWRVLKPREFELKVIPTYFEHAKFSSFVRQANGWGFRRMTQGRDRNCYYHEKFLRGLPHLCKMMKRPGISEKQAWDPDHEPDLDKISEEYPVPERSADESILLPCTLEGGPKARMPVYLGTFSTGSLHTRMTAPPAQQQAAMVSPPQGTTPQESPCPSPRNERMTLNSIGHNTSVLAPEFPSGNSSLNVQQQNTDSMTQWQQQRQQQHQPQSRFPHQQPAILSVPRPVHRDMSERNATSGTAGGSTVASSSASAAGAEKALSPFATPHQLAMNSSPNVAAAYEASSQFAAGFAAATALSQQQFRLILGQALAAATGAAQGGVVGGPVASSSRTPTSSGQAPLGVM